MIPAHGFEARYEGGMAEQVAAYDDEGYALVVDSKAGRLARAADRRGFTAVVATHTHVIPGGG